MLGGIGRRTIDALECKGDSPRRIRLTSKSVRWLEHEVEAWIKQRASASADLLNQVPDHTWR